MTSADVESLAQLVAKYSTSALFAEMKRLRDSQPPKSYCAQCWMNGTGEFEMVNGECQNPLCVLKRYR